MPKSREVAFVAFLVLRIMSCSDCQWCNVSEFWSDVVCSMRNSKIVNFHIVLDNSKSSLCCFETFIHDIARKCKTTIVSRTYMPQNLQNISSIDNNDMNHSIGEWPSIWNITSGDSDCDILVSRVILSSSTLRAERTRKQSDKVTVQEWNAWNIHVVSVRSIHSFDQISKNRSTFKWNLQDRFIVLIARQKEYGRLNYPSLKIDKILRTLWYEHKVQNVFVSEAILINDTVRIDPILRTYNPFAKVNDSVWGKIEIININTVRQMQNVLPNLTYRRTKDLNGYELKVGVLEQENAITPIDTFNDYSNLHKAFNEIALGTISRYMNFKAKRIQQKDNVPYGHQLSNGTYVGTLGDVVHGRTDICFVLFFIKKYGVDTRDVEFTTYMEFDRVCVIVPKADKIPKWLRIYHFFPPSVWFCSMFLHLLTYLTWYVLQILAPQRTGTRKLLTTLYPSFLLSAGCPQEMPNTNAERILLAGIFFASITMVGTFNGILYNSFARDMYYEDIDRLQDVDASGLPILFTSFSVRDVFGSKNDDNSTPLLQSLGKKLRHAHNNLRNVAYYRNVSGLIREHHFPVVREELIDADGTRLLHLVEECPGRYYLSYLLPRNSIIRERINVLFGRLNQAGLPMLWNRHTIQELVCQRKLSAKQKRNQTENKMDPFVAFKLSDMQTSFYMLLMGLSLSTIVFFHEKGWLKTSLLCIGKISFKSKHQLFRSNFPGNFLQFFGQNRSNA